MRIQDRKKYTASGSLDSVYFITPYIATKNRSSDEFTQYIFTPSQIFEKVVSMHKFVLNFDPWLILATQFLERAN
jgi:hypothetical protein